MTDTKKTHGKDKQEDTERRVRERTISTGQTSLEAIMKKKKTKLDLDNSKPRTK